MTPGSTTEPMPPSSNRPRGRPLGSKNRKVTFQEPVRRSERARNAPKRFGQWKIQFEVWFIILKGFQVQFRILISSVSIYWSFYFEFVLKFAKFDVNEPQMLNSGIIFLKKKRKRDTVQWAREPLILIESICSSGTQSVCICHVIYHLCFMSVLVHVLSFHFLLKILSRNVSKLWKRKKGRWR